MSTTVAAARPPRHTANSKTAARDLAALPSFVHSLDEFPYVEIVEPTILSWTGDESSRRASQAKLAKVLKGSKKTIAASSSEDEEPPLVRRLRMTAMPAKETTKIKTIAAMPPLMTRASTDSTSSASSGAPPTPWGESSSGSEYFSPIRSGRSTATATPCSATPRAHRTPQASPSRRPIAKTSSGTIIPYAPSGPAARCISGSLPAQNAMEMAVACRGPSLNCKIFSVGVQDDDSDLEDDEDSD